MISTLKNALLVLAIAFLLASCAKDEGGASRTYDEQLIFDTERIEGYLLENNLTGFQKTSTGLYYKILDEKGGTTPQVGDQVSVEYVGKNLANQVFDRSSAGSPITFQLGAGQVIKGWDEGIALITLGSTGTLIIPSGLAYGNISRGSGIGKNEVLVFDVKVTAVR
jgi:FKBP-type peptidyl-prolyl cis-trans isomerase FkpA